MQDTGGYASTTLVLFDLDDTLLPTAALRQYRHSKRPVDLSAVLSSEKVLPYTEIDTTLQVLQARMAIGIVTSAPRWYTEQLLQRYFSLIHFEPVVTYNDVQHLKPNPEALVLALRLAQVQPSEVVYVGNDLVDYQASQAVGVPFLGAQWSTLKTYPSDLAREVASPRGLVSLFGRRFP